MIYLLRHGEAERKGGDDASRQLTPEGERQSEAAGRAIAALGLPVDACLTSPKVRAADTARLACEPLSIEPEVAEELARDAFDALSLADDRGDVMLVGHNPGFHDELARLTGAKAKIRKGGLAIVDDGTLVGLLQPDELAAIANSRP